MSVLLLAQCVLLMALLAFIQSNNFSLVLAQLKDPSLVVETVLSGFETPIAMAFLGIDDMLVIEKSSGKVQRITNGEMLEQPLLDLDVANQVERGLLGIAVSKNSSDHKTSVFLYYTESGKSHLGDEERGGGGSNGDGGEPIGNRLYRFELSEDGTKLINPRLLLDLPYEPGPAHNGGPIAIGGPNNNTVCVIIGNLEVPPLNEGRGNNLAQNIKGGEEPDGRAGIICATQDGQLLDGKGILGDEHPLDMYFAYGIRNSFGLTFDPLTGNLWDTENGGFDEINLVEPGLNSGFSGITGSSLNANIDDFDEDKLVHFNGNGKYSDPELDLGQHLVPTAIVFLNSEVLGEEYETDMFVANFRGTIYHFELDESRTGLVLGGELEDKIADTEEELEDVTFAENIGSITDLKVGPDGFLYAVIFGDGEIVRIVPEEVNAGTEE